MEVVYIMNLNQVKNELTANLAESIAHLTNSISSIFKRFLFGRPLEPPRAGIIIWILKRICSS